MYKLLHKLAAKGSVTRVWPLPPPPPQPLLIRAAGGEKMGKTSHFLWNYFSFDCLSGEWQKRPLPDLIIFFGMTREYHEAKQHKMTENRYRLKDIYKTNLWGIRHRHWREDVPNVEGYYLYPHQEAIRMPIMPSHVTGFVPHRVNLFPWKNLWENLIRWIS